MNAGSLVLLGVIAGAHGIRGEVKLKSFTAVAQDIAAYGPLHDEAGTRTFEITALKPAKDALIVRLAGVDDRNAAEALKGTRLYVPRERLPAAEDGAFYHADLIGLTVVDTAGKPHGSVLAVENFGAGDLLDIGTASRSDLLPFTAAFVPQIDIAGGRMIIAPPAGFMQDGDDGDF